MNTTTTTTTAHLYNDAPKAPVSTSLPLRTESTRTSNETNRDTPVIDIQHLSGDDAQREAERAAEKINRKIKPLSKLKEVRQSIANTFHEEDENNKDKDKGKDKESNDSPPSEIVSSIDGTETPIQETVSTSGGAPIDPSHRPSEASISRLIYTKSKKPPKQPESKLIEIELPRQVDAQCDRGDRRFFQLPSDPPPEGDFVYEFLYQHQRGAFFLGTPKFSSKSLLPVDPDEWTDSRFETSAMDITDYELPDPSWEWVHKSWLVDMTGDVDEDGWEYAMTFHGSPWHGNYEILRSFARRRRWLRLRKRKDKATHLSAIDMDSNKQGKMMARTVSLPERIYPTSINSATWTKLDMNHLDEPSPFPKALEEEEGGGGGENSMGSKGSTNGMLAPPSKLSDPVDLYKILKKARSDREKLAYTAQYVVRYPGDFEDLEARLDKYLNLMDYESSRRDFLSLLAAYGRTKAVQEGTSNLGYYSDLKAIQQKVGKS
ncbi:hypothetical protein CPC16_009070 [Podila verticillata]|nr:hypothetical protein CPC16_009070 [Podila verticillata]